ncbi:hypothetical protein Syun_019669 [Stephania yunnanensis]|uniref:Uncharacterized protein n=1 Tax=Stephania yunnanensis TaxID=152371 RepID=A0AAP0IUG9_9MAGN
MLIIEGHYETFKVGSDEDIATTITSFTKLLNEIKNHAKNYDQVSLSRSQLSPYQTLKQANTVNTSASPSIVSTHGLNSRRSPPSGSASPLSPSLDLPLRSSHLAFVSRHHLDLHLLPALVVSRSPVATVWICLFALAVTGYVFPLLSSRARQSPPSGYASPLSSSRARQLPPSGSASSLSPSLDLSLRSLRLALASHHHLDLPLRSRRLALASRHHLDLPLRSCCHWICISALVVPRSSLATIWIYLSLRSRRLALASHRCGTACATSASPTVRPLPPAVQLSLSRARSVECRRRFAGDCRHSSPVSHSSARSPLYYQNWTKREPYVNPCLLSKLERSLKFNISGSQPDASAKGKEKI